MGLESRTWFVASFLCVFSLGSDRKYKPPNPSASVQRRARCCSGAHPCAPSANGLKLSTLPEMLVRKERRMRREKNLAWLSHKFNYSAPTQERNVY